MCLKGEEIMYFPPRSAICVHYEFSQKELLGAQLSFRCFFYENATLL